MELESMATREVCLRLSAILALVTTACLVGFDKQTKLILLMIRKQATFRDVEALKVLVYVTCAAAGYNFLQLWKHFMWAFYGGKLKGPGSHIYMAWICFLLDQVAVYTTFAANSAATELAAIALTGAEAFQWLKVCDKFGRFCNQIGASLLFGYVASLLMAIISSLSAYNLFRFYSPNSFLRPKTI